MGYSKHLYRVVFISLCFLLCKCTLTDKIVRNHLCDKKYYLTARPPGVVKIAKNFFYDQTEITNTDWREYMWWISFVFGSGSAEYKATIPDTGAWIDKTILKNKIACLWQYASYYLRHPAYQDYPVVGISQKQAIDFSRWRTDRVIEFILVTNKKFNWDSAPNRETYFTIKRYFTGNYKNIKPDTNFLYYPNFRLPTIMEWKMATHYADSINKIIFKDSIPSFRSDIIPCIDNDTLGENTPTGYVREDYKSMKKNPICNLRGNVSEWTSEDGVTIGGGWADKRQVILTQDTFHLKTQNAWTGFRNVCEWKRWTK